MDIWNCRPVSLTLVVQKIIELLILKGGYSLVKLIINTVAVFIDLARAFDVVPCDILLQKLDGTGIDKRFFKNMLLKVNQERSI